MSSSSELSATVLSLIFEFLVLELNQIAEMLCYVYLENNVKLQNLIIFFK